MATVHATPKTKALPDGPYLVVRSQDRMKIYNLPLLSLASPDESAKAPLGKNVLYDANGGEHAVDAATLRKIALVEDGLSLPCYSDYQKSGANFGSVTFPWWYSDKITANYLLRGVIERPAYIYISPPGRELGIRFLRRKIDQFLFLARNMDIYIKPSYSWAAMGIARLKMDENKTLSVSSPLQEKFVQAAVDRLGWKKVETEGSHHDEAQKAGAGLWDVVRFMRKACLPVFSENFKGIPILLESTIPSIKWDGRNVDFRFIVIDRGNGFEWVADYAKVGNSVVSNLSKEGHGEKTELVVREMLSSRGNSGERLQLLVRDIVKSMGEFASYVANKYTEICRVDNERVFPPYYARHHINPKMFGVDLVLVDKGGQIAPSLMEFSPDNLGMAGLEASNPTKYRMVTDWFAETVRAEYEKFAGKK